MCPVNLGPTFRDFHLSLSAKCFYFYKYICHAFSNILIIDKNRLSGNSRNWLLYFSDQLNARFVHAQHRKFRVVWTGVYFKNILHCCYKVCILVGRYLPVFALVRLKFIFFKVLQTVIGETLGTIFSSTIFSARSRTVHRLRPSGASEHANAISWASNSPPNWISLGGVSRSFRSIAPEMPSSTNLFFKCSRLRAVIPTASATFSTNHLGPCSPASSSNKARACNTVLAALFPLVEIACNSCRSSLFNVTLYRGAISSSFLMETIIASFTKYAKYCVLHCTRQVFVFSGHHYPRSALTASDRARSPSINMSRLVLISARKFSKLLAETAGNSRKMSALFRGFRQQR